MATILRGMILAVFSLILGRITPQCLRRVIVNGRQIDSCLTLAVMHNGTVITLFSLGLLAQADKLLETEKEAIK
ncbi:hypothetical protein [Nostoc sp.]|uniref:hypothetical protein n=1 Tax=Nostoc sp. TaxID=1180 RepID=UPI002FFA2D1A